MAFAASARMLTQTHGSVNGRAGRAAEPAPLVRPYPPAAHNPRGLDTKTAFPLHIRTL
jgi:hypothetical protein